MRLKLKLYATFFRFLKPFWVSELIILFLSFVAIAITMVNPYLLKLLIDDALVPKDSHLLVKLLVIMTLLSLFGVVINFLSSYYNALITSKIMMNLRAKVFKHILYLPQSFFSKNKIGDLVQKINNEVDVIRTFITESLLRLIKNLIMIIGYVTALCFLNYKLFLISIVAFPFVIISLKYFKPKIKLVTEETRKKDSEILGFFIEKFHNIKMIQSFNIYDNECHKLNGSLEERVRLGMEKVKWGTLSSSISGFLFALTMTIFFAGGGYFIINGTLTIGALFAFVNYLMFLMTPVRDMQSLYMDLIRVSVSMERVNEIFENKTIDALQVANPKPFLYSDKIIFKNVKFNYNEKEILKGINLTLEKGKTYSLVGASGAGKTTIINLLLKFYNPVSGSILIDDVPLQNIDIFDLRAKISYISQENQLFNDSIIENIRIGKIQCTEDEVVDISKKINIYNQIMLLDGTFNSRIGDQGSKISGGEKQKIAIARAFLKDADILILDEAFASLDSENEREILAALRKKFQSSTIIIISHRMSTIKEVDEVVFLSEGLIVEKGKPEDLMMKKDHYWRLFREQLEPV
jgi:ATP-binding cassette, subfamily B, putative efflux pump